MPETITIYFPEGTDSITFFIEPGIIATVEGITIGPVSAPVTLTVTLPFVAPPGGVPVVMTGIV